MNECIEKDAKKQAGASKNGGAAVRSRGRAGKRKCERRCVATKCLKGKEYSNSEQTFATVKEENVAIGICPFFLQDRGNGRVSCEGASLKFPDREARREFVYRLCAHPEGYKECRMRMALEHYYERKYEKDESNK